MGTCEHIAITPETCSGHPRIAGTRIRISNIVRWTEQGQSPEEIVAGYPQLSLADVYAALAFYFDNREEMDRLIADEGTFVEAQESTGLRVDADSLPS